MPNKCLIRNIIIIVTVLHLIIVSSWSRWAWSESRCSGRRGVTDKAVRMKFPPSPSVCPHVPRESLVLYDPWLHQGGTVYGVHGVLGRGAWLLHHCVTRWNRNETYKEWNRNQEQKYDDVENRESISP